MTSQEAIELFGYVCGGAGLAFWALLIVILASWLLDIARHLRGGVDSWLLRGAMLTLVVLLTCLWAVATLTFVSHWQEVGQ